MKPLRWMLLSVLALGGAAAASADIVTSQLHRFTATFPGQPEQAAPTDNATDATGKVISQITSFLDSEPGRYIALLMVDTYISPVTTQMVELESYMAKHVNDFITGIKATGTQTRTTFDGFPAITFTFEGEGISSGKGVMAFVPGEKPVGYLAVSALLPSATAADKASAAAFVPSIDIQR